MKLHYGRMLTEALDGDHGIPRARLEALVARFPQVQDEVRSRRRQGVFVFYGLGDLA
jgi:hypothetical protein